VRILLFALGGVFVVVGAVFFLQGVGVIGGSFMSGESAWAVIGAAGILIGGWLIRAGVRWEPAAPLDESE